MRRSTHFDLEALRSIGSSPRQFAYTTNSQDKIRKELNYKSLFYFICRVQRFCNCIWEFTVDYWELLYRLKAVAEEVDVSLTSLTVLGIGTGDSKHLHVLVQEIMKVIPTCTKEVLIWKCPFWERRLEMWRLKEDEHPKPLDGLVDEGERSLFEMGASV
jgi:hypothetical protein